jgi:four helix bundle protein
MPFLFENLLVYQKALDFADEVCQFTSRFDRGFGFLADQLNRAALSISTNLAEGNGHLTKADRRSCLTIACLP